MKHVKILLSPEVEQVVKRVDVGAPNSPFPVIPSLFLPCQFAHTVAFVSRHAPEPAERVAIAKSEIRRLLEELALSFVGGLDVEDPEEEEGVAKAHLVRFLEKHPELSGRDADVFHTRYTPDLGGGRTEYQPMLLQVSEDAPVDIEVQNPLAGPPKRSGLIIPAS